MAISPIKCTIFAYATPTKASNSVPCLYGSIVASTREYLHLHYPDWEIYNVLHSARNKSWNFLLRKYGAGTLQEALQ